MDEITERDACRLLLAFAGLTRVRARRVLKAGLAGVPRPRPDGSIGYSYEAVERLTYRPFIEHEDVVRSCPRGIAVARFGADRVIDANWPWERQREALAGPWAMSLLVQAGIQGHRRLTGSFPLVGTVCGFVVAGADIVATPLRSSQVRLELAAPGAWFDDLAEMRWMPGRGGRALHLWLPTRRAT